MIGTSRELFSDVGDTLANGSGYATVLRSIDRVASGSDAEARRVEVRRESPDTWAWVCRSPQTVEIEMPFLLYSVTVGRPRSSSVNPIRGLVSSSAKSVLS